MDSESTALQGAPTASSAAVSEPARYGVVVLTQGKRPADLNRGLESLLAQEGVVLDVVCVGNGWQPEGLPDGVKALALPENLGIPAGRNAGVPLVSGEFLFFLDDDAWLPETSFLSDIAELLRKNPEIGLVQPRVDDPSGKTAPRRWIPRLKKGSARHSSNVFSVWEGAVALRRSVFDATGGWPAPYWYAHEGIELAWRVWDQGFRVWYAGDLRAAHPVIDQQRHADYFHLNARNRVWLARRNLRWPMSWMYVGSWTLMQTVVWFRHPERLRAWFGGWRAGWLEDPWGPDEDRKKLSRSGVARMSRHGRPPLV